MGEILHLQIGGIGNRLGSLFWEILASEHGISSSGRYEGDTELQLERVSTYFCESPGGRFLPRAVLVNTGPLSGTGRFLEENVVDGGEQNWAAGFFDKEQLAESVMDCLRREAEKCSRLQGFQLVHSLSGDGLAANILDDCICNEFPGRIVQTFSAFSRDSDIVLAPFSAVLTISHLLDTACGIMVNICDVSAVRSDATVAREIACATSTLRFSCLTNQNLRKLAENLVPFPQQCILRTACAPAASTRCTCKFLPELAAELLGPTCEISGGLLLASAVVVRGRLSHHPAHEPKLSTQIVYAFQGNITDWDSTKVSYCDIPMKGARLGAGLIVNSTGVQERLTSMHKHYRHADREPLRREGIDESDFADAENTLLETVDGYQQLESCCGDTEEEKNLAAGDSDADDEG